MNKKEERSVMNIKVIKPSQLSLLQQDWEKIEKQSDMTYFQTYEWNKLLVEQFNKQMKRRIYRKVRYVTLFDNCGNIRIIVPLRIKRLVKKKKLIREIELLGADSFSDYVNLIYPDNIKDEEFSFVIDYIKRNYRNYTISWRSLPKKSKSVSYLKHFYAENVEDFYKTVVIPVNRFQSFEEYYQALSKSTRQNYRTSCNRMKKDNVELEYKLFAGKIEGKLIDTLLRINLERTIEKNPNRFATKFSIIREKASLRLNNIIRNMMTNLTNCWTLVTYLNGDAAGFLTGARNDNNIYVMMNKVKPEYEFYSPMIVSIIEYIKDLYEVNFNGILDFGRGTETYKYKLGGEERNLVSFKLEL